MPSQQLGCRWEKAESLKVKDSRSANLKGYRWEDTSLLTQVTKNGPGLGYITITIPAKIEVYVYYLEDSFSAYSGPRRTALSFRRLNGSGGGLNVNCFVDVGSYSISLNLFLFSFGANFTFSPSTECDSPKWIRTLFTRRPV